METLSADAKVDYLARCSGAERLVSPVGRWRSLHASIWRKGDIEKTMPPVAWHAVLMCLDGRRAGRRVSDAHGGTVAVDYGPGSLCFLPAGHRVDSAFVGRATDIHVLLHPDAMSAALAELWSGDPAAAELRGLGDARDARVEALVRAVRGELVSPGAAGDLLTDGLATALCALIADRLAEGRGRRLPPPSARGALDPARLRRVLALIEESLGEGLPLGRLAAEAGLGPHHFARAFRAATGFSPHAYLVERRIARATAMLAEGNEPIAAVAYACGFASQAHMTHLFTRRVGVTPGRVRARSRA